jgi:RNA polymerase sigma-70 factor, ECF subfamily
MDATSQFVQLWTRHQAEVERYVFMMVPRAADAAEVLQEVSVQLWEKWDNYDTSRPFVPWAIRFAYLEVLKWRQRQAREKLIFSDSLLQQLNQTLDEEAPLTEARNRALETCLTKLTEREKTWIQLRYGRHGAVKEEAERRGLSLHKVYYAIEKIRGQLLHCIEQTLKREGWSDA